MAAFPGAQPPAASIPANFPGVDPAASSVPAYLPAARATTGPAFPAARPSPFQASFPASQSGLASQAPFPGAQAFNPPFPAAQTSLSANFAGTLPAATPPPNALPGAEPTAQDPAFIRNPALLGPPPLVQIYPPIIRPTLDLYIEETHYIVRLTQRPLEVGGLFGTALLPLNKPAILRGEAALMAGSPQTSSLDVSPI